MKTEIKMPKKNWTPEERQAFADKMKAARASARAAKKPVKKAKEAKVDPPQVANDDVASLLKRIQELEQQRFFSPQPQQAVRAITKYSIETHDYPNPSERLSEEPKLQEHAFKQNYVLKWKVGKVQYSHDGVSYTEPKFVLEVWRWKRDPETNELTNKQYRIHKGTFFEDPDAAIQMATELGLEIDETLQKPFLDEMRYLRMRDWVMEIFYPPKAQPATHTREEVIGNRLVPVLEINSRESVAIPFDKLKM